MLVMQYAAMVFVVWAIMLVHASRHANKNKNWQGYGNEITSAELLVSLLVAILWPITIVVMTLVRLTKRGVQQ